MTDTEALPPHPSHATVRDWMPVSEALRLADLWTVGDLNNSGQWRAAIKVLADETRAALAQRQQVPEGWRLVPVEPTADMERAAFDALELLGTPTERGTSMRNRVYRAMLAAAPALTAAPPAQPSDLHADFERECADTDKLLTALGWKPENYRTDGGSLKLGMILEALEARDRLIRREVAQAQPQESTEEADRRREKERLMGGIL